MTSNPLDTNSSILFDADIVSLERWSKTDKEFRRQGGSERDCGVHKLQICKNDADEDAQPVIVGRQGHALTHNSSILLNNAKAQYAEGSKRTVVFYTIDHAHFAKGNPSSFRVRFKSEEEAASFLTILNKHFKCKCTFQEGSNVCEICGPMQAIIPTKLEEAASNDEDAYEAKPTTAKSVIGLGSDSEEDEEGTPSDTVKDFSVLSVERMEQNVILYKSDEDSKEVNDDSSSNDGSAASDESFYLDEDFANSQAMPNIEDLTIIHDL